MPSALPNSSPSSRSAFIPPTPPNSPPATWPCSRSIPNFEIGFRTALKTLWVTKLRPRVAAQRCGISSVPANDCVLLTQLRLPIVKTDTTWTVDGDDHASSVLDDSLRPVLLSSGIAQSTFGTSVVADSSGLGLEFLDVAGSISAEDLCGDRPVGHADHRHHPGSHPRISERSSTSRPGGKGEISVEAAAGSKIDERGRAEARGPRRRSASFRRRRYLARHGSSQMSGGDFLALEQPVSDGGIESVNFFNGRLLTGGDMQREQRCAPRQ